MSSNLAICSVLPEVKEKLKKFRLRKSKDNAAIVMKIDKEKRAIIEDEIDEDDLPDDYKLDDLGAQLPEYLPRYIAYSYRLEHKDGRVSYPLVFIFVCPDGAPNELMMMYAGSKTQLVKDIDFTKVFELRSYEEMTEEWLVNKLLK